MTPLAPFPTPTTLLVVFLVFLFLLVLVNNEPLPNTSFLFLVLLRFFRTIIRHDCFHGRPFLYTFHGIVLIHGLRGSDEFSWWR